MNQKLLAGLIEGVTEAVKGYTDEALGLFDRRLKSLTERVDAVKDGANGEPGPAGRDGVDGRDGKDAEPLTRDQVIEAIKAMPGVLEDAIAAYLAEHPPAAGKDGTNGIDGKDGAPGLNGKDGVGMAGAIIDRDGVLVATMTDGSIKSLGVVVGKDGQPGARGQDGADGLGFDDIAVDHDGERAFSLKFFRGERVKAIGPFVIPAVLDRGVWQPGSYAKGDGVTLGGSYWIAQSDTTAKPGGVEPECRAWRLAVKKGADAKPVVRANGA